MSTQDLRFVEALLSDSVYLGIDMAQKYKVRSQLVPYPGMGAWHFLHVDKKQSALFKEKHATKKRGFGSIRVTVIIGKSTWKTSIFPDKQSGTYLLPVKKQIRHAEGIDAGDMVNFTLSFGK